jgi:hypothetical protein
MGFYDLSKPEREQKCKLIEDGISWDLQNGEFPVVVRYFDDSDTYIRT